MFPYEALRHAVKAHGEELDKCGQLYVLHPIAVAEAIETTANRRYLTYGGGSILTEDAAIVALLHDVLEDTNYVLDAAWFHPQQWDALYAITKQPHETYFEYIKRVSENRLASIVKLADLWHNLQPERQKCLPGSAQLSLEARYLKAARTIWDAQGHKWWPG